MDDENQDDNCQVGISRAAQRNRHPFANYGNGRRYLAARLDRDGFHRLARLVERGTLAARFAVELSETVPAEHLEAVVDRAELVGPRRPTWWDWEFVLTLPITD